LLTSAWRWFRPWSCILAFVWSKPPSEAYFPRHTEVMLHGVWEGWLVSVSLDEEFATLRSTCINKFQQTNTFVDSCINLHRPFAAAYELKMVTVFIYCQVKIEKGKAIPLQAWTGPEGSRRLRLPHFMTTAQDSGKIVSRTHWPTFPTRKCSWYSFLLETESTPGP